MLTNNVTDSDSTKFCQTSTHLNPVNGTIVATYVLARFNFRKIRLYLSAKHKPWCCRLTGKN